MSRCTSLLICPVCGAALVDTGTSLRCASRHNFDRSRHGHIDLLPPGHGHSTKQGDVREMLDARVRFLASGHYDRIADAIAARAVSHLAARPSIDEFTVLDAGCGTGWYAARTADALAAARADADTCTIGVDISRDALRLAARVVRGVFIVNDVAHRICVADGAVDLLLNVFAPRNAAEFARVLRPEGLLLVVIPAETHLRELRARLPLLAVQEDKLERTLERLSGPLAVRAHDELTYRVDMTADTALDAVRMGPTFRHIAAGTELHVDFAVLPVTVAVHVLALGRRP